MGEDGRQMEKVDHLYGGGHRVQMWLDAKSNHTLYNRAKVGETTNFVAEINVFLLGLPH